VDPPQSPQEDLTKHYHDGAHEHLLLFRSRFEHFESLITELHTKLQALSSCTMLKKHVATCCNIMQHVAT
jgi:hypothetical protein